MMNKLEDDYNLQHNALCELQLFAATVTIYSPNSSPALTFLLII